MATPTQLQLWLKDFPRAETEARIRELKEELEALEKAMALHHAFIQPNGNKESAGEQPNRPNAIRMVLREANGQPMAPGEIKDELIAKGWLTDDQKELKRFYSAMSTMNKRRHLLRLDDGRYILPTGANR